MNINEEQAFDIAAENELIAFRKRQYSQTRNIPENNFHDGFNRGWEANTKWQEQQSANDAIGFMQFRDDHCTKMGERWMTLFAGDGGKLYTIKELYKLWQQRK